MSERFFWLRDDMDGMIFLAMSCGRFVDFDVRYVCIRDWKDGRGALGGKEVASVWWICARDVWSAAGVAVGFSRFRFLDDLLDGLAFAVADEAAAASSVVVGSSWGATAASLLSMVGFVRWYGQRSMWYVVCWILRYVGFVREEQEYFILFWEDS